MNQDFEMRVKLENKTIDSFLEKKEKRGGREREALFLYIWLLRQCRDRRYCRTSIGMLLGDMMEDSSATKKRKSMRESLNLLVEKKLIKAYYDRKLTEELDFKATMEMASGKFKAVIDTNTIFYVVARESEAMSNYTLITHDVVDDVVECMNDIVRMNSVGEKGKKKIKEVQAKSPIVDSMSVVAKLCQMISRRDTLYCVCYPSQDLLSEKLGITPSLLIAILKQLKDEGIIHFEMFELNGQITDKKTGELRDVGIKHYVYAMAKDAADIQPVIEKAIKNGRLTQDCKRITLPNTAVEIGYDETEDAEYEEFFNENIRIAFYEKDCGLNSGIELNQDSVDAINLMFHLYGEEITIQAIRKVKSQIAGREDVGNPTGYFIKALPKIAEQIK